MSVYDSSPEAMARFRAQQQRCYNWSIEASRHVDQYKVPFGARSDAPSNMEEVDPEEIEARTFGLVSSERDEMFRLLGEQTTSRSLGHDHFRRNSRRSRSEAHRSDKREHRESSLHRNRPHSRHSPTPIQPSSQPYQFPILVPPIYPPSDPYYSLGHPSHPFIPSPTQSRKSGGLFSMFKRRRSSSIPRQVAPPSLLYLPQSVSSSSRSRTKSFDAVDRPLFPMSGPHSRRSRKPSVGYEPNLAYPYSQDPYTSHPHSHPHMASNAAVNYPPYAQYIYGSPASSPVSSSNLYPHSPVPPPIYAPPRHRYY